MPLPARVRTLISGLTTGQGSNKLPDNVKKVILHYQSGSRVYGMRHFLHRTLPRVQYNNPNVEFELDQQKTPVFPEVIIQFGDATKSVVKARMLNSDQLYEKFNEAAMRGKGDLPA
ncbi:hypothetical protein H4R33_003605 [Dimargaris cristalligena]|uniref:Uncharacterized protein n=1 Tax=Dimargaris cristalligena TaxID=215637 RepID=A0A4P9ZS43_9FUNG|nr:hypothetical protein H4R33_003605 [Dimargaris cristalligena]RKP36283.1 hypothetical protein BJ085DRAFT_29895 [Dimargaris cristalligena]|eukprot:RKP36283.1 hypothetical protein BJ085DRAFT_29895 [Dimargaris cristalligena]